MKNISEPLRSWVSQVLDVKTEQLTISALAAEASFRQFYRLSRLDDGSGPSWILMDSPPAKENNDQFCHLAGVFGRTGLPVPEILAAEHSRGWFLLTDLGSRDLERAYQDGDQDAALDAAIGNLVRLQQVSDSRIGPYTAARFADELDIFSEWFIRRLLGTALPAHLDEPFQILIERATTQPQCCIHRDYHCRNLLYSAAGSFGIVDFQDALMGPASYDIASLLRDCYHEFPEADVQRWLLRFLQARNAATGTDYPLERFVEDADLCAIQRQLKAIGIFARLQLRDGKSSHLGYISPLLRRLTQLCATYPAFVGLSRYLRETGEQAAAWQN